MIQQYVHIYNIFYVTIQLCMSKKAKEKHSTKPIITNYSLLFFLGSTHKHVLKQVTFQDYPEEDHWEGPRKTSLFSPKMDKNSFMQTLHIQL